MSPPEPRPDLSFRKLTDAELTDLIDRNTEFAFYRDRWREVGSNTSYGAFRNGMLGHISFFITEQEDRRFSVRQVQLDPREAEITSCYTLTACRGYGLYPYSIRSLCQVARQLGIRRVFMITSTRNQSSRHGIEKGGLRYCGLLLRYTFPFFPSSSGLIWREFRRHLP